MIRGFLIPDLLARGGGGDAADVGRPPIRECYGWEEGRRREGALKGRAHVRRGQPMRGGGGRCYPGRKAAASRGHWTARHAGQEEGAVTLPAQGDHRRGEAVSTWMLWVRGGGAKGGGDQVEGQRLPTWRGDRQQEGAADAALAGRPQHRDATSIAGTRRPPAWEGRRYGDTMGEGRGAANGSGALKGSENDEESEAKIIIIKI